MTVRCIKCGRVTSQHVASEQGFVCWRTDKMTVGVCPACLADKLIDMTEGQDVVLDDTTLEKVARAVVEDVCRRST